MTIIEQKITRKQFNKKKALTVRASLPLALGDLMLLTLGISELLAYTIDPLPKIRDCIGYSGDNYISNETCHENEK